jgi:hypothetical protein
VRKIEDYLKHAAACRQMANNATNADHRQMLLQMVETWEGLAKDRSEQLARQRRMSILTVGGTTPAPENAPPAPARSRA